VYVCVLTKRRSSEQGSCIDDLLQNLLFLQLKNDVMTTLVTLVTMMTMK